MALARPALTEPRAAVPRSVPVLCVAFLRPTHLRRPSQVVSACPLMAPSQPQQGQARHKGEQGPSRGHGGAVCPGASLCVISTCHACSCPLLPCRSAAREWQPKLHELPKNAANLP